MSKNLKRSLFFGWFSLSLILPLLIWIIGPPAPVLDEPASFFRSLGQASAIIGLVLFTFEFILAARWRWVESLLTGLNQVYAFHHLLGGLTLIFLLFHPLFLGLQYAVFSVVTAAQFFLPAPDKFGQMLGSAALTGLILLLILTFYVRLKYETWKFTHQFLGIVYLLAFVHTLLVPSILSQNHLLKNYLIAMYLIGLFAFIHTVIIKRYLIKKHDFTVHTVTPHPGDVLEIVLKPVLEKMTYHAGQFAFFTFFSPYVPKEPHPFSLTSNPKSPLLSLGSKTLGDFTATLSHLKPGDKVLVDGPYGHFNLDKIKNPNQIWLAGGIGITPFLGFLRTLRSSQSAPNRQVWLFYSFRGQPEAAFLPELIQASQQLPWFKLRLHDSAVSGRFNLSQVAHEVPALTNYDLLLCGPAAMIQAHKHQAKSLNWPQKQIHSEVFTLYN